jgi:ribosomal protein S18 acetylase RimI-like enzyme
MQGSFQIRAATLEDAAVLAELAGRTFYDAFAADTAAGDLAAYIAQAFGLRQQTAELEDPRLHTLIGEAGGVAVAYAQLRQVEPPDCVTGPASAEIARFYLERSWHGRGPAQTLMDAVLALARDLGVETLWLGVWERNLRAIAFYRKHGFVDVGSHEFVVGTDRQTDRIMVRPL